MGEISSREQSVLTSILVSDVTNVNNDQHTGGELVVQTTADGVRDLNKIIFGKNVIAVNLF